jgi:hypothetical protein
VNLERLNAIRAVLKSPDWDPILPEQNVMLHSTCIELVAEVERLTQQIALAQDHVLSLCSRAGTCWPSFDLIGHDTDTVERVDVEG